MYAVAPVALITLLISSISSPIAAHRSQANNNHHHQQHHNPPRGGGGFALQHNHNHNHNNNHVSEFGTKGKICIGTNGRMSVPSNRNHHYRNLKDRFTNCTYVDGNLELTWLQGDYDLSFLQNIREVTGYVLISHLDVSRIIFPRLQIIRGRTLFRLNVRDEEFALMVTLSTSNTLELPALRDILNGSVGIYNNYNLCHVKTINWDEIITGQNASYFYTYNFTSTERECPKCHQSCAAGCWGEGPENCQKFSKTNCSPQCWQGRCFGSNPRECCHLFCAGGCTGPTQSDCLACRNFYDDGLCTQECPPMQRYNPTTYSWEANPNGKYAYGATCVRNCPEHLLKDNGACVRSCPPRKTAVNGECIPCDGTCPKTCPGVKVLHSGNVDSFKDCTIIDGSLEILDQSFKGFQQIYNNCTFGLRFPEMDPDRLEVFSTLKEVTGYVNIQGYHEKFTNLTYFRNLEIIGGRQLMENYFASLYIIKTALKSLELKSLKKINSGAVAILENKDLCFAEQINWKRIQKSKDHKLFLISNKNETLCKQENLVCDAQCTSDRCWGSGPDQCLSCRNFQFKDTCLENCSSVAGIYQDSPKTCKTCHPECESTCNGPHEDNCSKCKHARDGPFCVPKCPTDKFMMTNGVCTACHDNCVDGCRGPANTIGPDGCNSCEKAIINGDITVERCLQKNESCPDGYYYEWVGPQEQGALKPLAGKAICRKCHPRCKKCTGYGFHEQACQECTKFKRGEQCEDECPQDHYVEKSTRVCESCHSECKGCTGPDVSDCKKCRNFKIFIENDASTSANSSMFNCSATCPPDLPHKIFSNVEVTVEPYCSAKPAGSQYRLSDTAEIPVILGGVVFCVSLILMVFIGYFCWKNIKAKKDAVKMTMVLTGCEDNEPLRPTQMKPNIAKLRIIKEAELRKGGILGFGAFGKVFKGVWVPEGDNVKIPVAIKVLRETGANTSKEFLDEAYIMASVDHPNLLQLLAVCLTQEMMLVTQLMPFGCLLDYVRTHREKIGSKALLNWCTQIARGMAYLEEKRLVHRDLAARNVLVQTPSCVKITDFGLAKLLNYNEDEYKAAGGKMPIKWLALECIQHRIFTHKSDVWAFGVTIWELLTYGGKPYEKIPVRDVPELIENGLKLPQPNICTLDIYCIMVSCWMLDADSRPTFKELASNFAEMARDPGRYLVIPGDRFMKLPQQDEKELIRSLSSTLEGPEALMQAHEYLQPGFQDDGMINSISLGSTSLENGHMLNKPCSSNSWQRNVTASVNDSIPMEHIRHQGNWGEDMVMYTQVTCPDDSVRHYCNSGLMNSDGSDPRYCGDQSINIPMDMEDTSESFDSVSRSNDSQVLKIDLPVDEDDYLLPFTLQAQGTTSYMDLIGETNNASEGLMKSPTYQKYPDFLPTVPKKGLDNPEYLLTSNENLSELTDTCGLPTPPEMEMEMELQPIPDVTAVKKENDENVAGTPTVFMAQKSIEEESISDHEYYNDLQRELQPLRRNETAV